ncbi:sigma factor-like helix-turn-helix DNA-binding protein [Streptomyces sp. NPDC005722]
MGERREAAERLREAEFEAFAAGAAGRLLHVAVLLTGDRAEGTELLCAALSRTYADWFRMRGEDPYAFTRAELVRRFAHRPRWRRPRGGVLGTLGVRERLVIVLRLYEGIAEEQAAAQLGMPSERVRAVTLRATAALRSRPVGGDRGRREQQAQAQAGAQAGARGAAS